MGSRIFWLSLLEIKKMAEEMTPGQLGPITREGRDRERNIERPSFPPRMQSEEPLHQAAAAQESR